LPRTTPLMYLPDERDPDRVYVFASAAGAHTNPSLFNNVVAHPTSVTVEIGTATLTADATPMPDPAREQIYAQQASRYRAFAAYQTRASRRIPVVALSLHRPRG
jgi:deazaflavin-dependent oxidoreductase (nitroreductase family)